MPNDVSLVTPTRVLLRYRWAALVSGSRDVVAAPVKLVNLHLVLQKQFEQFQKALLVLTQVLDKLTRRTGTSWTLELIHDLPIRLDAVLRLPHAEVLGGQHKPLLQKIRKGLDVLNEELGRVILASPLRGQKTLLGSLGKGMTQARRALASVEQEMNRYASVMVKVEERERQQAEKARQQAEKARQRAEKAQAKELANAEWCEKNCPPCRDDGAF
jgi:hypothetical protein